MGTDVDWKKVSGNAHSALHAIQVRDAANALTIIGNTCDPIDVTCMGDTHRKFTDSLGQHIDKEIMALTDVPYKPHQSSAEFNKGFMERM
jgi:hypothetical protein